MAEREKRRSRVSIRWKTLGVLGVFVLAMIGLLWLFQIVLLDDFYMGIKKKGISRALDQAAEALRTQEETAALDAIAINSDVCIEVVDQQGGLVYRKHLTPNCIAHNVPADQLIDYYRRNTAREGEVLVGIFDRRKILGLDAAPNPGPAAPSPAPPPEEEASPALETRDKTLWRHTYTSIFRQDDMVQSMLCMQMVTQQDVAPVLLAVNARLTPVEATIETLRLQLLLITALLTLLAVALAFYLSGKFARPVISINREAKKLARGDFSVRFEGRDYLEAAELADTLNYAAAELSRADELRRELMANISHDLRTPLTMIEGFAELMRDLPSENTPQNAQVIIDEARYLSTLVCDILDLSRLETGLDHLLPEPFALTAFLRAMLSRYETLIQQEHYHILVEAEEDFTILADPLRIQQVIYNLVNNAIAYTGQDKLVRVRQVRRGSSVRVEVADTGRGIAQEDLPYIWDRYYKVDKKNHRRAVVGTGLGLSIVKKILVAHGAAFGVDTSPKGSVFWFELPLCGEAQQP